MPIYKQSVNARRMTSICWAPPGKYIASTSALPTASIGLCTAFLNMSRHLQFLLVV